MKRPRATFHAVELLFSLLMFLWFLSPLSATLKTRLGGGGIEPLSLPRALYGASRSGIQGVSPAAALLTAGACLVLAISAFKLLAPFISRSKPRLAGFGHPLPALLDIVASAIAVLLVALHMFRFASKAEYFSALPWLSYAAAVGAIAFNAYSAGLLVSLSKRTSVAYREYLEFRKSAAGRRRRVLTFAARAGIQTRLLFSFVGLFLVIIAVLSSVLMVDFRRTILQAVIFNGSALTERAASVIKANIGDKVSVLDFFAIEKQKNETAEFRFNSLCLFQRMKTGGKFLATASTEESLIGTLLPERFQGIERTASLYNAERETYEFIAPVILSGFLIGYVYVDYGRDLIYEPCFRTQVKVVSIGALFLYLSVFLVYIFGANIVHPILFLRMSVNRIAKTLSGMTGGTLRISADLLRYEDKVPTGDEIKDLSGEIEDMTAVIRGLIPYISASTFRQAEKSRPSSEAKELAFLFTDIRGFSSLCEGKTPAQVVGILNRYLEIQSNIIHRHGGDIDKFVGDGIMATFDGPEKELHACRASMEIRTAIAEERETRARANEESVSIGIGVNSGPVVFGSVGAKDRMDFTSIGDTVNLAARLEGANKTYGTKSLITEAVWEKVKEHYLCREIDLLTVQGKKRPVRIFEILQERDRAGEKLHKLKEGFERGLGLYRELRWDQASKAFGHLSEKYGDGPSAVFMERIDLLKTNPPPKNWNGVFSLTVK